MKYKRLCESHPRLNLARVRKLRAMYRGGCDLLEDIELMKLVFPKYTYENDNVYAERIARAYYENMFAMVINQIAAGLAQDPANFVPHENEADKAKKALPAPKPEPDVEEEPDKPDEPDADKKGEGEGDPPAKKPPFGGPPAAKKPAIVVAPKLPELDKYWTDLLENATPLSDDGSTQRSFDQVIRDMVVEALVTGWSWAQTELPDPAIQVADPITGQDIDVLPSTLGEQEKAGKLRAYVVLWPTDQVTDWADKDGRLLWVRTYQCDVPADDPEVSRGDKVHTWTVWDATGWTKYVFVQEKDKPMPGPEIDIPAIPGGTHSFGRVPWTMFDVCSPNTPGTHLWVGDVIESLCRQYFNRTNGEAFQWSQFYYQQLYEFLGPEVGGIDTIVGEAQSDPGRAHRRRAPGVVHVRGMEDRAEFVGPDMSGVEAGRSALQDIRDAILRIVAQMALAQDTSGAMLRRSADSKRQDSVAQEIVLGAIGKRAIIAAVFIVKLLAAGRKDSKPPQVKGYERFNVTDAEQLIAQAVQLSSLTIESAAWEVEWKYQLATTTLGDNASAKLKSLIREQLESAITQDAIMNRGLEPLEIDDDGNVIPPAKKSPFGVNPKKQPPFGGANPFAKKGDKEEEKPK